jgi:hypothetical protein
MKIASRMTSAISKDIFRQRGHPGFNIIVTFVWDKLIARPINDAPLSISVTLFFDNSSLLSIALHWFTWTAKQFTLPSEDRSPTLSRL